MNLRSPVAPECAEALVALAREVAATKTFEELAEWEEETPLNPTALDDLIHHARDLLDTFGLHPQSADEKRERRELGYAAPVKVWDDATGLYVTRALTDEEVAALVWTRNAGRRWRTMVFRSKAPFSCPRNNARWALVRSLLEDGVIK